METTQKTHNVEYAEDTNALYFWHTPVL